MRSFASDNNSGVHPAIMEALTRANRDHALGYGDDLWTEEAVRKIKETFVADCEPLFVFNGTGSNVIALQLMTRPYNSILCAETAHIYVDECGSPVKMTGCQIRPIATPDGKLTPQLITPYLHGFADQHHSQPGSHLSFGMYGTGYYLYTRRIESHHFVGTSIRYAGTYGRCADRQCLCFAGAFIASADCGLWYRCA